MFTALASFLGGSVFRMLWGELSSWLSKQQDHKHEIDKLRAQEEIDAAAHGRNLESLRVQAELGIKEVFVKAEAAVSELEASAWSEAVKAVTSKIGIKFIDAWNGIIRPAVATWAIVMITIHFGNKGWILDENGWQLAAAALGIYLADRTLFKRGK